MSKYKLLHGKNSIVLIFSCFLFFPLVGGAETLKWIGCGISKKAFMAEIVKAYKEHSGIDIEIEGGGATKGIHSVSGEQADLGGTCRHRFTDATGDVTHSELNAKLVHVAWDALVPIVNPRNRIYNISSKDLKKVYNGEITSWEELGGNDARILLCTREGKASGVGHMLRLLVFNDPTYEFKRQLLTFRSTGPLEKEIEAQEYGFGVTGVSSAKRSRKLNVLAVDGVAPSKRNIESGAYPLFRPLYLASHINVSPEVKHFIEYILCTRQFFK